MCFKEKVVNMKVFSKIMTLVGICVLFFTCAALLLSYFGVMEIGENRQSMVFCALGIALLCYAPRKYVAIAESERDPQSQKESKSGSSARRALVMQVSAGIIMLALSLFKFLKG